MNVNVRLLPDLSSEAMERFIRKEKLALFRKRLAEAPRDDARQILLKLIEEEEAKEPTSQPKSKS